MLCGFQEFYNRKHQNFMPISEYDHDDQEDLYTIKDGENSEIWIHVEVLLCV